MKDDARLLDSVGWYGKLPVAGDFVQRRLPRELVAWWDRWLQLGLGALRGDTGAMRRSYAAAPIWNFAIASAAAGSDSIQLGCIAPSRDRVGRCYPLCAVLPLAAERYEPRMLAGAGDFYRQVGAGLLGAVRDGCGPQQLDRLLLDAGAAAAAMLHGQAPSAAQTAGSDIMAVLNSGRDGGGDPCAAGQLAWPDLPMCFNPYSHTSYWWTSQVDGAPLQTYLHGGAPNAALFAKLFVPLSGARRYGP